MKKSDSQGRSRLVVRRSNQPAQALLLPSVVGDEPWYLPATLVLRRLRLKRLTVRATSIFFFMFLSFVRRGFSLACSYLKEQRLPKGCQKRAKRLLFSHR